MAELAHRLFPGEAVTCSLIETTLRLGGEQAAGAKTPGKASGEIRGHGHQLGFVQLADRQLRLEAAPDIKFLKCASNSSIVPGAVPDGGECLLMGADRAGVRRRGNIRR